MLLDEIKYISGSDDLGPFTPLQPFFSNINNRHLYPPNVDVISTLMSIKHTR